ncbi:MAG TPA: DUF3179 domain-containing (seleno)protein [Gemmataceae bacterium]|nr:DUF3179 domain-containing (seleno)protein [Gemmataceae bacterium]
MSKALKLESQPPLRPRGILVQGALVLVVAAGLALGHVFLIEPYLHGQRAALERSPTFADMGTPFIWPGIDRPKIVPAGQSQLRAEDQVIGVAVNGKARAYLVSAFGGPQRHVVNDVLAGQPVSVTHCDISQCTRVFTASSGEVLGISCGGWHQGGLLLFAHGAIFLQGSGGSLDPEHPAIPLAELPHLVTTWGQWKSLHPNTDIYEGEPPARAMPPIPPASVKGPSRGS